MFNRGVSRYITPAPYFAFDSFSGESSLVDIDAHTGELGMPWVNHPHANYTGAITTDAGGTAYATGQAAYHVTPTSASADYTVEADFVCHTTTSNTALAGRMHVTDDTMYIIRWNNNVWELRRIIASAQTTIGSTTNQLLTASSTKHVRLVMAGTAISVYIDGVLEIGPITDNNITAVGKAGIRILSAQTSSTGVHIDNFKAT